MFDIESSNWSTGLRVRKHPFFDYLRVSLDSPLPKSVIFSFVHSHFKNLPNCYSNHYNEKPHLQPS